MTMYSTSRIDHAPSFALYNADMDRYDERQNAEFVDPVIEVYKQGIDRTLIRENLRLTPQQRLERLQALMRGIDAMNRVAGTVRAS